MPDFAYAFFSELGAPRGRLETFTEVRFKDADGNQARPDGAVLVTGSRKAWSALVEVKTGRGVLASEQVNRYLDLARDNGFSAVVTVSNEITARPTDVPVGFDKRKAKRVDLFHLSWWRVLTTAIVEHRHRGVSDPDQAWILGELIAYLDHENSGASGFQDMGSTWVSARDASREGTLRASDLAAKDAAKHWEQFLDYLALGLSQDLGRGVETVRPRKLSTQERVDLQVKGLVGLGRLEGELRVPDAAGLVGVTADLRARQVVTSADIDAPRDGARPLTRVNWLLRQLTTAPPGLRVSARFANVRDTSSGLLSEVRDDPSRLLNPVDPKREIRGFEIALTRPLGLKNGKGKGSFIADTRQQVFDFYADALQNVVAWQSRAPRLPEPPEDVPEAPQSSPPPFVAAASREPGEGRLPTEQEAEQPSEESTAPPTPTACSEPGRWEQSEPLGGERDAWL